MGIMRGVGIGSYNREKLKRLIVVLGILTLLFASVLRFNSGMGLYPSTASIWINDTPQSTDPIEYDSLLHHIAFRPVYSSVVSQYRVGKIEPVLIKSWSASNGYTTWTLEVGPDLKFENGDPITSEVIAKSWLRAAHVMKSRGSHSGFFEKLHGYNQWPGPKAPLEGLKVDSDRIILNFNSPFKNFLETVSFGLYAVVHPSCYDSITGAWLDPHCLISSGPYRISSWKKDQIELKLRDDFPHPINSRAIAHFIIRWDEQSKSNADLILGTSSDSEFDTPRTFYGTPASQIAYVRCNSWRDRSGPCGNEAKRRELRSDFYEALHEDSALPDFSFLPTSIPEIHAISSSQARIGKTKEPVRYRVAALSLRSFSAYNKAMETIGRKKTRTVTPIDMPFATAVSEVESGKTSFSYDLIAQATGLLIESPKDDIRFMFLSKEGIRLPDTDGRITAELKKTDFDPQVINELIWDQAVIWPLAHFSLGLWAKKDLFDFSKINLSLPPTDLQYIQWK